MNEAWHNKYMGIPFKEKGRDFSGVDCWGLVYLIYKMERGIELFSYDQDYESTKDYKQILRLMMIETANHWEPIGIPEEFDSVSVRMQGEPWHCGLMLNSTQMLHIEHELVYPVISRVARPNWKHRILGYYRYVG
jgi:hypothetical protein